VARMGVAGVVVNGSGRTRRGSAGGAVVGWEEVDEVDPFGSPINTHQKLRLWSPPAERPRDPPLSVTGVTGRGLHSSPFPLDLRVVCPFPLNSSSLCPPYNPKYPVAVARRSSI
jgi:hypothetical protein